jgi:hypothetical protein
MPKTLLSMLLLTFANLSMSTYADDHKQVVCHEGKEISVADAAVPAHLKHGDTVGECEDDEVEPEPETRTTVVMLRCEGTLGREESLAPVEIVSASSSVVGHEITVGLDCAVTLSRLLNIGYIIRSVTSGSTGDSDDLRLQTDYLLLGKEELD